MVIAQRRVGQVRARIAGKIQESLSEMTAITQETLSVFGHPALQDTPPAQRDRPLRRREPNQIRLQVQAADDRPVVLRDGHLHVRDTGDRLPRLGVADRGGARRMSRGTIVAFTTVQARLLFPLMGPHARGARPADLERLFARIFEYLDLKPSITDAPPLATWRRPGARARRVRRRHVPLPRRRDETRPTSTG